MTAHTSPINVTATSVEKRDYSLTGPSAQRAIDVGLASAEWYHSEVPRKVMKELMQRSDGPAIRDTILLAVLLVGSAFGGIWFWDTWLAVPFFIVYGVLYGSASDSRWHECGHGTAFKTQWMSDAVYQIASFMLMRNPVSWRWSHARHHTDTSIVGRDPEIAFMHPVAVIMMLLHFVGVVDVYHWMKTLLRNSFGILTADERNFIPESEVAKATSAARVHIAIYILTIAAAITMGSFLPLMLIGGPRIYGAWHGFMTGLLQHGGLAEDVVDHRLNSRTVLMNPISRWIYWNMNYHVEHHMFPMVPYHALPRLHALIKTDLPAANPSIFNAFCELVPSVLRQQREPGYYLRRELPPTAKPYREEFHLTVPERASMGVT